MLSLAPSDSALPAPDFTFDPDLHAEMDLACIPAAIRPQIEAARLNAPTALSPTEIEAWGRRPAERPLWMDAAWFGCKYLFWMGVTYAVICGLLLLSGGSL